ncbi:hypothetical protein D3C72_2129510 [compost metagenome]
MVIWSDVVRVYTRLIDTVASVNQHFHFFSSISEAEFCWQSVTWVHSVNDQCLNFARFHISDQRQHISVRSL